MIARRLLRTARTGMKLRAFLRDLWARATGIAAASANPAASESTGNRTRIETPPSAGHAGPSFTYHSIRGTLQ